MGYPSWILLYFMKNHSKIDDLGVLVISIALSPKGMCHPPRPGRATRLA